MAILINTTAAKAALKDFKKSNHLVEDLAGRTVPVCEIIVISNEHGRDVGFCIDDNGLHVWYRGYGAKVSTNAIYIANLLMSNVCDAVFVSVDKPLKVDRMNGFNDVIIMVKELWRGI